MEEEGDKVMGGTVREALLDDEERRLIGTKVDDEHAVRMEDDEDDDVSSRYRLTVVPFQSSPSISRHSLA